MPRVMVLHTGGTLGMIGEPLEPGDYTDHMMDTVPELSRIADIDSRIIANVDSSDMTPTLWAALAHEIDEHRDTHDGFVIIHGTDTMAYTASALSFALKGLDRPVILTGAQRPLAALRTDARRNLADAVELATCDVPEVGICFDGLLLRGCRATKSNAMDYRAFESPGVEPIARLGVDIALARHIRRPTVPFDADARFNANVLVLRVTPGLSPALLEHICSSGIDGLILVAFGLGTVPSRTAETALAPVIRDAIDAGVEVLILTHSFGRVDLRRYRNSIALADAGAIEGGSMGVEAATTKLMHALSLYKNRNARRRYLEWNVAGELV